MIILGIDPGLATTGIGVVEQAANGAVRYRDWCTIETPAGLPVGDRLAELANDLSEILEQYSPRLAVIERLFFATNRKTAMDVSQARGVLLLTVQQAGVEILEPTPLELKTAVTGDGQADKVQIKTMLERTLQGIGGEFSGCPDDATDAVALAMFGAFELARSA